LSDKHWYAKRTGGAPDAWPVRRSSRRLVALGVASIAIAAPGCGQEGHESVDDAGNSPAVDATAPGRADVAAVSRHQDNDAEEQAANRVDGGQQESDRSRKPDGSETADTSGLQANSPSGRPPRPSGGHTGTGTANTPSSPPPPTGAMSSPGASSDSGGDTPPRPN
jgi:hypothetical protein